MTLNSRTVDINHLSPQSRWSTILTEQNHTHQVAVTEITELFELLRRQQVSFADGSTQLTQHCQMQQTRVHGRHWTPGYTGVRFPLPELTARVDGCQKMHPSSRAVNSARELGP